MGKCVACRRNHYTKTLLGKLVDEERATFLLKEALGSDTQQKPWISKEGFCVAVGDDVLLEGPEVPPTREQRDGEYATASTKASQPTWKLGRKGGSASTGPPAIKETPQTPEGAQAQPLPVYTRGKAHVDHLHVEILVRDIEISQQESESERQDVQQMVELTQQVEALHAELSRGLAEATPMPPSLTATYAMLASCGHGATHACLSSRPTGARRRGDPSAPRAAETLAPQAHAEATPMPPNFAATDAALAAATAPPTPASAPAEQGTYQPPMAAEQEFAAGYPSAPLAAETSAPQAHAEATPMPPSFAATDAALAAATAPPTPA
ncbi:hypothetical protein CYMTET_17332 [Cymbomonas tetramitiformis]|uniref:Uncharacterized protein n=1 Tax=Cymbomonas tetramitiformis TaxID=36881 RepID=A0AAE0GA36_9CHLO|nr:hypothetical protein CYMTET_17332 [Cymbomonas tetramitiformis]